MFPDRAKWAAQGPRRGKSVASGRVGSPPISVRAIPTAYARWILSTQSRSTLNMQRFEPSIHLAFAAVRCRKGSVPLWRLHFGTSDGLLGSLCSLLSSLFSLLSSLSALFPLLSLPLISQIALRTCPCDLRIRSSTSPPTASTLCGSSLARRNARSD